jgi:hypothetical protein
VTLSIYARSGYAKLTKLDDAEVAWTDDEGLVVQRRELGVPIECDHCGCAAMWMYYAQRPSEPYPVAFGAFCVLLCAERSLKAKDAKR